MKRLVSMAVWGLGLTVVTGLERSWAQTQPEAARPPAKAESKPALCPVMGDEPVNFAISVPSDAGPVYFCCTECVAKYQANPTKYAEKVSAQRAALAGKAKVQTTCPVSGEPVKQDISIEHEGKKINFCCKGCAAKFQGEPDKYKAKLANSYTYQTKCPITEEEIDPQSFTTAANGQKVYFCCPPCEKKFLAEPAKYAPKLAAQGYVMDKLEMKKGPNDK